MKKILIFIFIVTGLSASYTSEQIKEILKDSDYREINKILHTKDAVRLLERAVWDGRMDVLKKVAKTDSSLLNLTDGQGNDVLMLAAFLAKPEYVKFLVKYVNPNRVNERGVNSLQMVPTGLNQMTGDLFLKNEKFRKKVFETIRILKEHHAKFEYFKDKFKTGRILYLLKKQKPEVKKLFFKLMNDKQKMFAYIVLGNEKKAKEILDAHPEFLKNPYFLDYPAHFLWTLAKLKKYGFIKYMLEKAKENNVDLPDYIVTSPNAKNVDDIEDEKFWSIANPYMKSLGGYEKEDYDTLTRIPFNAVLKKDYKRLEDYTKYGYWNFVKYGFELGNDLTFEYYTPLLMAIEYGDKKAVGILLKNGGYISGWNEIHYKILRGEPLGLEKYPLWERVFKVNQRGILDGITPITLALMYNPKYVKELLKYIDPSKVNRYDFHFAIKDGLAKEFLPYVKYVSDRDLILLLEKHETDVIKELYKRGIIDDFDIKNLGAAVRKDKDLTNFVLKKLLLRECKENESFLIYPRVNDKEVLKCLKAGYKFGDDTLVTLIQEGNPEIMKYLVKYKNHKIKGKYYPLFFITKKEYINEFTTPENKSQKIVPECVTTMNKKICEKAVKKAIELGNYPFAANIAIRINEPQLVKKYVDKLPNIFKMCYYLETDRKKAKEFAKKTKAVCPLPLPKK